MNCNTCRYELSQCLDGRLPSGRRALVMQHTAECDTCAGFWDEMQAAQRLALRLPREQVGGGFREQLWERIRAGEGTPDAVFRDPIPMLVKARYALTGAAAAAAVLLFGLWLHDNSQSDRALPSRQDVAIAGEAGGANAVNTATEPAREQPGSDRPTSQWQTLAPTAHTATVTDIPSSNHVPMLSSAQPLTANLVAAETARQIESRYASVSMGLRRLGDQRRVARESENTQRIVELILRDAGELREFADVLLDLRERERVSFRDPDIGADLRLVSTTLAPFRLRRQSVDTVQQLVEPTVHQSQRLGNMESYILTPSIDPREEASTLIQMRMMRPEVFPKLFIFVGYGPEFGEHSGLLRQGQIFLFEDMCGPSFVAPRSQVEAANRLR